MSDTKWTPGPWKAGTISGGSDGSGWISIHAPNADRLSVASATPAAPGGPGIRADHETVANASLIAAAPDLYEALDRLVEASNPEISGWSEAVAALAKARGEL